MSDAYAQTEILYSKPLQYLNPLTQGHLTRIASLASPSKSTYNGTLRVAAAAAAAAAVVVVVVVVAVVVVVVDSQCRPLTAYHTTSP